MALAQFGFVGFIMVSGDELGITTTKAELDGLVHFWRVIGYILGMEDKYNICMETVEETQALCKRILNEVFLPALANRSKTFNEMGRVLLESLWCVTPLIEPEAFTAFTFYLASTAAVNNNHSLKIDIDSMTAYSKFVLRLQLFTHRYLLQPKYWWSGIFHIFFNALMRLSIYLTEHFPFLAYYLFGVKQSHVKIFRYTVN